ncbi:MAG: hypothetical protein KDA44_05365 [Planctomycetales bacterium]|nr:hypothetical protein [Planctomycetales bacterium]
MRRTTFGTTAAVALICLLAGARHATADDGVVFASDLPDFDADWNSAYGEDHAPSGSMIRLTQGTSQGGRNDTVRAGNRTASRSARSTRVPYMIGDQFGGGNGSMDMYSDMGLDGYDVTPISSVQSPVFGGNRFNVAEANSTLPTDRFIFSYRHLSNAFQSNIIGQSAATDIEHFVVGFEKTFLDGMGSVQFQVPLLRQLNSDLVVYQDAFGSNLPATDRHGELGNLATTLKLLLIERQTLAIGGGVAVTAPTGDDASIVGDFDTTFPLANNPAVNATAPSSFFFEGYFPNHTVNLVPFLAWAYHPANGFFHQGFLQVDAPLNSSPARVVAQGTITPDAIYDEETFDVDMEGRIKQRTLLRANLSFGYWFQRGSRNSIVQGVAGLFEAHYTHALDDPNSLIVPVATFTDPSTTYDPFSVNITAGGPGGNVDIVNLSTGFVIDMGSCQITNGVIVPVSGNGRDDRAFDFEYNLQVNRFF